MNLCNNQEKRIFTDHEKTSIIRYGATLCGIHARLAMEGYFLKDGRTWNIFKVGTIIGSFIIDDEN